MTRSTVLGRRSCAISYRHRGLLGMPKSYEILRPVLDCTTGSLQAYTHFSSGFFELESTLEHYFPEYSKIMTEIIRAGANNFYESPDFHGLGGAVSDGDICERESVRKHGAGSGCGPCSRARSRSC